MLSPNTGHHTSHWICPATVPSLIIENPKSYLLYWETADEGAKRIVRFGGENELLEAAESGIGLACACFLLREMTGCRQPKEENVP